MAGYKPPKSKIAQMDDLAGYFTRQEQLDPPVSGVRKVQTPAQKMSVKKAAAASVAKRRSRMIGGGLSQPLGKGRGILG